MDNCYMNYKKQLANTTVDQNASGAGMRQWVYQTCAQFGYCKHSCLLCAPSKKRGYIVLLMSVGLSAWRSVGRSVGRPNGFR